jgi:hypothetical protein
MALITKTDLYYSDYSWTVLNGDNPKITGEPDSTLLNRKEGYEILYFVNKFCELNELKQKASATKVERMIRAEVPNDIHSQKNIKEWIEKNWKMSKF